MTKQTVTESEIVEAALAWLDAWEHAARTNYAHAYDESGARAAGLRILLRKYRQQQKDAAGREDAR